MTTTHACFANKRVYNNPTLTYDVHKEKELQLKQRCALGVTCLKTTHISRFQMC